MEPKDRQPGDYEPSPDDISELIDDIRYRADQRRKALEISLENAKHAATPEERQRYLLKAMEFGDILDEYIKSLYPELFPDDNPPSKDDPPTPV